MELTKKDKILILIILCSYFACIISAELIFSHGIPEEMVLYANLLEFVIYMHVVVLFALLVSIVAKMELTKKDKILVSVILCLTFVHVAHGILYHLGIASDLPFVGLISLLVVLFVYNWVVMIATPIYLVFEHTFPWDELPYIICCILAWVSLFVLIKYTKGMKLVPRIVYLCLIPPLVTSLAFLHHGPFH